jgi:SPP1 gp7 family putative phage head morphogenesis protein
MTETELQDAILRHALDLQRLSAHNEAEAVAILQQMEDELRQLLNSANISTVAKSQITALINDADDIIKRGYSSTGNVVDMQGIAKVVADNTVSAMADMIKSPTAETLASLARNILIDGSPASAWWAKQADDTAFKFAAAVRQGVVNGETLDQITSRITGKRGFMEVARANARTLVHYSVMTAANESRLAVFRKNARMFSGVRWLSTLDSHTCTTCAALDGQRWDLDGKPIDGNTITFMAPPAHFSCRCVLSGIPKRSAMAEVFPNFDYAAAVDANRMRASSEGPIKANTSFDAFLSRQSPEFIANTLGNTRAKMFKDGKLTLRDLVSGKGRPLTLKELAAK